MRLMMLIMTEFSFVLLVSHPDNKWQYQMSKRDQSQTLLIKIHETSQNKKESGSTTKKTIQK